MLSEFLLKDWEQNLQGQAGMMEELIVSKGDEKYNDLLKASEDMRVHTRTDSRYSKEYRKVKRAILRMRNLEEGGNGELEEDQEEGGGDVDDESLEVVVTLSPAEKKKKISMIVKGLRHYTVSGKDGKRYKGLSPDSLSNYAGF